MGAKKFGSSVEMDSAARRRFVAAWTSDERPTISALARRFGRSMPTLRAILVEEGISTNRLNRGPRNSDHQSAEQRG